VATRAAWLRTIVSFEGDSTPRERLTPEIPRTSRLAAGVILACVGVFLLATLSSDGSIGVRLWEVGTLGALALLAALISSAAALHVSIFSILVVLSSGTSGMGMHPFPLLFALAGYGLVVVVTPELRETTFWLHSGSLERGLRPLVIVAVVTSATGMSLWFLLAGSEVSEVVRQFDELPVWALLPVGATFAVVNAGAEEAAFRGILMDGLVSAVGLTGALLIQAIAFGVAHYPQGLPNGTWGAFLSAVYGLMLGVIRLRARGMLAPWIAHAATDLTIFLLLLL
jgi:uncharacterized protein